MSKGATEMKIPVHLYSNLQRYTGNQAVVETHGSTVGECLDNLVEKYPALRPLIFNENGQVLSGVYISINLESPKSETKDQPLRSGDRLYIILIVAGG
ncbi:MAG TPA: MoaD/ThiS family protein [Dehalococcoidales bacterium]|nr:MoaD/ThiS family protein [Dehalococcoidales bacterium]